VLLSLGIDLVLYITARLNVLSVKKDFSKEMSGIEDVLKNVLKSKVIVYDLARGEIEVDFYLPISTLSICLQIQHIF
jgi:hypothetical protein